MQGLTKLWIQSLPYWTHFAVLTLKLWCVLVILTLQTQVDDEASGRFFFECRRWFFKSQLPTYCLNVPFVITGSGISSRNGRKTTAAAILVSQQSLCRMISFNEKEFVPRFRGLKMSQKEMNVHSRNCTLQKFDLQWNVLLPSHQYLEFVQCGLYTVFCERATSPNINRNGLQSYTEGVFKGEVWQQYPW